MINIKKTERWRPIPGHEGAYEISDKGRVRSLDRIDIAGNRRSGQIRKTVVKGNGYHYITLNADRTTKAYLVHRLVLHAFARPPKPGEHTRHLDGDPTNNNVANLRWGTPKENARDRIAHGRDYGTNRGLRPKLSEEDVRLIRQIHASRQPHYEDIAKLFGVKPEAVRNVVLRITWRDVA